MVIVNNTTNNNGGDGVVSTLPPRVYGCVIGVQKGRTVEIFNSFELLYDPTTHSLDRVFLEKKQELYKKVFPNFYILGWYSTGSDAEESDMHIHRAVPANGIGIVPMALSVSASSVIPSLNSSTRVGPASASSSTKLQFPFRTRLLRIGTRRLPASSRPRFLPLESVSVNNAREGVSIAWPFQGTLLCNWFCEIGGSYGG